MSNEKVKIASLCPLGDRYQRYWDKLSALEKQMQLDAEGLYSMDLQEIAMSVASKILSTKIVDAFCGIGGAAIAFARSGKSVHAIEIEPRRLEMARFNSALFGVQEKIKFLQGDALKLLIWSPETAIYLDPPWGGPSYGKLERFSLTCFSPDGGTLLKKALSVSSEVLFKFPKNFDFSGLASIAKPVEVISNELNGSLEYYTGVFRS